MDHKNYAEFFRIWQEAYSQRGIAAVTPVDSTDAKTPQATPEEEAHVRLLFEEDDALQRRVADVITELFFGAQGVYGTRPAQNCDALFKQLAKHARPNDEFRKLVEATFRKEIETIVVRIFRDELQSAVAKQAAEMLKYSRRITAAPKGPRR